MTLNRSDILTQTTATITLDVPSAAAMATALYDERQRLAKRLERMTTSSARRKKVENHLANLDRAILAFSEVDKQVMQAPMFTPEYEARVRERVGHHDR